MKERKSNFELLRILSMLLIVMHHFSLHTPWGLRPGLYYSKVLIEFFSIGGKIGVNCFILISAYFMVIKSVRIKSLLKIWGTTLFYSVSIFFIAIIVLPNKLSLFYLLSSFFPVMKSTYWFVTIYILLYIFSPYLNTLLTSLSKRDYQKFILIQFISFSIVATLMRNTMLTNELLWGIFLYSLGGYIRLHLKLKISTSKLSFYLLISLVATMSSIILLDYLSTYFTSIVGKESLVLSNTQGFFPLISSVLLFLIFKQINIGSIYWINTIAPTMFSVYLIHDNLIVRPILWSYVKTFITNNTISILLVGIIAPLTILIIFSLIDLIRIIIIKYALQFYYYRKSA